MECTVRARSTVVVEGRYVAMTATTVPDTHDSVGGPSSYRPDVQGLRAVAVLLVVAFHAGLPLTGGFVGVDVFFVISGFVITALILRQVEHAHFSFQGFFARRAKRLTPALAVMVIVVFGLSLLFQSPLGDQQITAQSGAGALFLVANFVILRTTGGYFDAAAEANPLLHTWSLSVEEQIYLLFPLLVVLVAVRMRRRATSFKAVTAVIVGIAVVSFLANVALSFGLVGRSWTSQPEAWAFYLPVTRAWEFAVGALIAVWWHGATRDGMPDDRQRGRNAAYLAVAGLLLIGVSAIWINDTFAFPGLVALLPVLGTALVIIAGGLGANRFTKALSTRPMTAVGDMSYSIYLWHWPIIVFALALWPAPWTGLMAALLSFIPAYLAYRFIEQPIRVSKVQSPRVILFAYLVVTAVIVAAAWSLVHLGSRLVPYASTPSEPTIGIQNECLLADRAFEETDVERCRFPAEDSRGWILLTGDSHAESFSNAVIEAGNDMGFDVVALTGADCVLVRGNEANARVSNCDEMADSLLDRATGNDPPAVVVLAQRGIPVGIRNTFGELSARGVPVLRIEGIPQWRSRDAKRGPNPCSGGILNATCELPRDQLVAIAPARKADEAAVIKGLPNIVSFDPWPVVCSGDTCSAVIGDSVAYSDASHLNSWGSSQFREEIKRVLADITRTGN